MKCPSFKALAAAACGTALIGCGPGLPIEGEQTATTTRNEPASSAGLWQGSTSTNRTAFAALLSDGKYWVVYSTVGNPNFIAGVIEGTATSVAGKFTSGDALDFNIEGLGITSATISGTYVPKSTLSGAIRYSSQNTTSFSANYLSAPAADLSQIAGTYNGSSTAGGAVEATTVVVDAGGRFTGSTAGGCNFTGSAAARTDVGVFNASVTYGSGCLHSGVTVTGISFYDAANRQLLTVGLNAARTIGAIGVGTKQ
jgi:hypothetical protein